MQAAQPFGHSDGGPLAGANPARRCPAGCAWIGCKERAGRTCARSSLWPSVCSGFMAEASLGCAPAELYLRCRSCTIRGTSATRSFANWARPTACCAPSSTACSAARARSRIACRRRQPEQAALFRSLGEGTVRSAQELQRTMKSASDLCARVLRLGSEEAAGEMTALLVSLGAPGAEQLTRDLAARSAALGRRTGRGCRRSHAAQPAALSGRRLHRRGAHPHSP